MTDAEKVEAMAKAFWDAQSARTDARRQADEARLNRYPWGSDRLPGTVWDGYRADMRAALLAVGAIAAPADMARAYADGEGRC